ncbi:MAG: hypothetical protein LAP86_33610 [Acidobacteriia bacterium]|nr:hypothetical protein [Terriglobia bacterium]
MKNHLPVLLAICALNLLTGCNGSNGTPPPPALAITSGAPPTGVIGNPYADLLTASGGKGPYTWTWAAGTSGSRGVRGLPPGLTLSNATIAGTPTEANTYNVVVTVSDSQSPPAQKSVAYAITIAGPPPAIDSTRSPQEGAINYPYSFAFGVSDGLYPFTWSETGALPPGMSLATDGTLTGTPTATGSFPITVMVSDSLGRSAIPQNFTIGIAAHGFKATGSMATGRAFHSATLLQDGRVLVAGGLAKIVFADFTYYVYTATAELYDPSAGTFSTTGSMTATRSCHIATLLTNGQVLITGSDATTEIFDPASGTFTPTGNMLTARGCSYTATLLTNGKVLVAGGEDSDSAVALDTAELYDPSSGTFSPTGSMGTARVAHAATLLTSGKVLVSGGANGGASVTAELYNPNSGSFSSTGDMTLARAGHTATLLTNGKVLITGGSNVSTLSTAAETFDPATGSFTATGSMADYRSGYTAILLGDGTVLVAGGWAANGGLSSAELFDPATGLFSVTGSMITGHAAHTATLLNDGTVLVVGGYGPSRIANQNQITCRRTAELYQ